MSSEDFTFDPEARGAKGAQKAVDRVAKLQQQLQAAMEDAKEKAERTLRPSTAGRKMMSPYQKAVKQLAKNLEVIGFAKFEQIFLNTEEAGLDGLIRDLYSLEHGAGTSGVPEEDSTGDPIAPPEVEHAPFAPMFEEKV